MVGFDRQTLVSHKMDLEKTRDNLWDEFQRLVGAIQLCDALIAELDAPEQKENQENL